MCRVYWKGAHTNQKQSFDKRLYKNCQIVSQLFCFKEWISFILYCCKSGKSIRILKNLYYRMQFQNGDSKMAWMIQLLSLRILSLDREVGSSKYFIYDELLCPIEYKLLNFQSTFWFCRINVMYFITINPCLMNYYRNIPKNLYYKMRFQNGSCVTKGRSYKCVSLLYTFVSLWHMLKIHAKSKYRQMCTRVTYHYEIYNTENLE